MSSILTRLLEKGLPTRDVQIATTGEQQQRPLKFEGAQEGNFYNGDLLVVGGLDSTGAARHFNLDQQGRMVMTGQSSNAGGSIVPVVIQGENLEGTAASTTNPVLMAGRYDTVPRSLAPGELGAIALNSEGKMMIDLQNASLTATVNVDIDQATDSIQLYATDGTANRAVRSDAAGRLTMVGAAITGTAVTGNPVLVGGSDGTNARSASTDTSGRFQIVGGVASDSFFSNAGNPVIIGTRGTDNNTHYALSDPSGRTIIVGHAAPGNPATGNPVLVSGNDGTNTRSLATDTSGRQKIIGAVSVGTSIVGTGDPVLMGASTDTGVSAYARSDNNGFLYANARGQDDFGTGYALRQDENRNLLTAGPVVVGHDLADIAVNPTIMGGVDGTIVRYLSVNGDGATVVAGMAASGAAVSGTPVLTAGSDGTNARTILTTTTGAVCNAPRLTRIHRQRCNLDVTDGSTDNRIVGVQFVGLFDWSVVPFKTTATASQVVVTFLDSASYLHTFKIIGINASGDETEETLSIPALGSTVTSVGSFKCINEIKMITAMEPGEYIRGVLTVAQPSFFLVAANYQYNPFFMCPNSYKARLKGITMYSASANANLFLQVYDINSTAIKPGLFMKTLPSSSTNTVFPEPGAHELSAGEAALWVISGGAAITANFTAIWELIPV